MNLPIGASAILDFRRRGLKPSDPIAVCLTAEGVPYASCTVRPKAANHDWGFLAGLDVIVFVEPGAEHVRATLDALAYHAERIALWDVHAKRGMDLWPIWAGVGRDVHHLAPQERRDWRIKRWARLTWLHSENRRFDS